MKKRKFCFEKESFVLKKKILFDPCGPPYKTHAIEACIFKCDVNRKNRSRNLNSVPHVPSEESSHNNIKSLFAGEAATTHREEPR